MLGISAHRPHAVVHPATNLDFVPVAALRATVQLAPALAGVAVTPLLAALEGPRRKRQLVVHVPWAVAHSHRNSRAAIAHTQRAAQQHLKNAQFHVALGLERRPAQHEHLVKFVRWQVACVHRAVLAAPIATLLSKRPIGLELALDAPCPAQRTFRRWKRVLLGVLSRLANT